MIWAVVLGLVFSVSLGAQIVPAGFEDRIIGLISSPTAIAFTPDGRMLVATQPGALRVFVDGILLPGPALQIPSSILCTNSERGLLGVAVDPEFLANRQVYLYYTLRRAGGDCGSRQPNYPFNRVSRFVLGGSNTIDPASETVLIDGIPSFNGNHNAGDLHFGKDGYLYISTGDGGCDLNNDSGCQGRNDAARDVNTLLGKILRVDREGNPAPGNPWSGPGSAPCRTGSASSGIRCQETFAYGLRNPFRLAFDPNSTTTRFFINDVGDATWEEINEGAVGADYGWNVREGFCATASTTQCAPQNPAPAGLVDPIYAYRNDAAPAGSQSTGCSSIAGGAFVPNGSWPAEYDGSYLFSDYVCATIFLLRQQGGRWVATDFARNMPQPGPTALTFGPHEGRQALYYATYARNGEVHRIASTAARPPALVSAASFQEGAAPAGIVSLFGGGLASQTASAAAVPLPFELGGATVTVRDGNGVDRPAPLYLVSPSQFNFVVPDAVPPGRATITTRSGGNQTASLDVTLQSTAPGLFTMNQNGSGPPAAFLVSASGTSQPVYECGAAPSSCTPAALSADTGSVLVLFGTGFRGVSSPSAVVVQIGGLAGSVQYAGPQPEYPGLDQLNVALPAGLAGRGEVDLRLSVDGRAANPVTLRFR